MTHSSINWGCDHNVFEIKSHQVSVTFVTDNWNFIWDFRIDDRIFAYTYALVHTNESYGIIKPKPII